MLVVLPAFGAHVYERDYGFVSLFKNSIFLWS